MLAIARPDAWNLPLLLHVGGAMVLVGALVTAGGALVIAARGGSMDAPALSRLGFRTLLIGALPAYVVMRAGAQWIASKEGLADSDVAWIGIGYSTSEGGLLLLIIGTVLAGLAARKIARGDAGAGPSRVAPVLTLLLVIVYLVTMWAMVSKPT